MKVLILIFITICLIYYHLYTSDFNYLLSNKSTNPKSFISHIQYDSDPKKLYHLAKLYHELSNGKQAIHYYQKAYRGGCTYALMDIADIYCWGLGDVPIDLEMAKKLYTHISLYGSPKLQADSNDKLNQISENELAISFPSIFIVQPPVPDTVHLTIINDNIDNIDTFNPIRNDPQNVHDTAVVNTIKGSIDRLKSNTPLVLTKSECFDNIRESTNKPLIHNMLKHIKSNDTNYYKMNMRISDALQLVWNRIDQNPDQETKKNSQEMLLHELENSYEYDKPVCSVGIFNRIIDTLNVSDPLVEIKPKWAVKEEILNKSSKIRDDLFNELNPEDQEKYNQGNLQDFDDTVKNTIRSTCKNDYVDSNILSQESLDAELNEWIEYI